MSHRNRPLKLKAFPAFPGRPFCLLGRRKRRGLGSRADGLTTEQMRMGEDCRMKSDLSWHSECGACPELS